MELVNITQMHKDIFDILAKNNLCYGEALEALRITEIALKRIMLPKEVSYLPEQTVSPRAGQRMQQ